MQVGRRCIDFVEVWSIIRALESEFDVVDDV